MEQLKHLVRIQLNPEQYPGESEIASVKFVDGLSEPILPRVAKRIASNFGGEFVLPEGAENIDQAIVMQSQHEVSVATAEFFAIQERAPVEEQVVQQPEAVQSKANAYSAESLGEIADKEGIKGLREVAREVGAQGGKSIAELIENILAAQK
ncbi:hypothetical protein [Chitinibacter tainanensis]|uniref:hypothetical protein n=1 Tax=Chitinibacter tainanensis TaxID=230667 RepID=UPI000414C3CD|nr:hypothetical protein [Chitinibacter tainanensis]